MSQIALLTSDDCDSAQVERLAEDLRRESDSFEVSRLDRVDLELVDSDIIVWLGAAQLPDLATVLQLIAAVSPEGSPSIAVPVPADRPLSKESLISDVTGWLAQTLTGVDTPGVSCLTARPGSIENSLRLVQHLKSSLPVVRVLSAFPDTEVVRVERPGSIVAELTRSPTPGDLLSAARFRFPTWTRLAGFCCVGASGVVVDLTLLSLGLMAGIAAPVAAALAIWGAMSWNFALNRWLTFADRQSGSILKQYVSFCLSCLVGGCINWSIRIGLMSYVSWFGDQPFAASIPGILAGTAFNFALCNRLVFRKLPQEPDPTSPPSEAGLMVEDEVNSVEPQAVPVDKSATQNGLPGSSASLKPGAALARAVLFVGLLFGATWATSAYLDAPNARPAEERIPERDGTAVAVQAKTPPELTSDVSNSGTRLQLDIADASIEKRLREEAAYLSHDDLEGRGVRTRGLDLAAEFIANRFRLAGLDTQHYGHEPFQVFRLTQRGKKGVVQNIGLTARGEPHFLDLQTDYTSVAVAPSGRFDLPVAFVGYGITAPEVGYDDYEGLDVEGHAVIVLRHSPTLFDGNTTLAQHSYIRTKIRNAREHGAAAVLLCTDRPTLIREQSKAGITGEFHEPLIQAELTPQDSIPTVHVRRSILVPLVESACEFDVDQAETRIEESSKPLSRLLPQLRAKGTVATAKVGRKLRNVLGLLHGHGRRSNETIVLGAHYDHLGRGGFGSLSLGANHAIHNGADDNASGTAILMEVARQLRAREEPLKRSVLFIAFSGEELGLLGSKHYARDPLIPMNETVAMLNLDMVGRLRDDNLTVYGTGTSPFWREPLGKHSRALGLVIKNRPGGLGPSDHASFYEKGVPVLHFFTGFHRQYHRPSDDIEQLNVKGMRRITSLVSRMIVELAESESAPARSGRGRDQIGNRNPQTLAGILSASPSELRQLTLGVVPAESKEGLVVRRVVPASPAARAGLRAADLIVSIDGGAVKLTKQLSEIIRSHKSGDVITLQIRRNGILLEVKTRL